MLRVKSLIAVATLVGSVSVAQAETVTIKVGYSAGGGTDARARVIAQHLDRFYDGDIDVVVSNVPGAGSAKLMRMMVTTEPNDGSVLAMVSGSMPVSVALRDDLADIDMSEVRFVTTLENQPRVCVVRADLGIETLEDFRTKSFKMGATGRASATYVHAAAAKRALDANYEVITGFKGAAGANAAILRGEIAGRCAMEQRDIARTFGDLEMNTILQIAASDDTLIGGTPSLLNEVQDPLDKQALSFLFTDTSFFSPIMVAPGTPEDILARYRAAFAEMVVDPEFIEDVAAINRAFQPRDGSEAEAWVRDMQSAPSEVITRAKALAD